MKTLNQDKYIHACNFASKVHNGQIVPGTGIPYINHIGLVAMEAMAAVAHDPAIVFPDLLVLCAVLHDTIEDTGTTYEEITALFGTDVANGVQALSKSSSLPSKEEKMKDSLERIRQQPNEIWMVKLADRITNLQPPPNHWTTEKISRYKQEAETILSELGGASAFLSERLREKIVSYGQYDKSGGDGLCRTISRYRRATCFHGSSGSCVLSFVSATLRA